MDNSNRFNFTADRLRTLPPAPHGSRTTFYDSNKHSGGLQLRVTDKGVKTFCVHRRIAGKTQTRITIGRYPDWTLEKARREAMRVSSLAAEGVDPNAEKRADRLRQQTFGQLFETYVAYLREEKQRRRVDELIANYQRYLGAIPDEPRKPRGRKRQKPQGSVDWSKRYAAEITTEMVKGLRDAIGATGRHTTANRIVEIVAAMYSAGIAKKWIETENPAKGIEPFKEKSRTRYVKGDEIPLFFQSIAAEPPLWRDLFLLALLTGARRGNVQSMAWSDLDLYAEYWTIPGEVSKNGDPMVIPLTGAALQIISSRKAEAGQSKFLFPAKSKSGHVENVKGAWKRIVTRAGLSDLRPHDLRRSLGSWMVNTGASIAIVGGALGHKDAKSTEVYSRIAVDPVREAMERAQSKFLGAAGLKEPTPVAPVEAAS